MEIVGLILLLGSIKIALSAIVRMLSQIFSTYSETNSWFHLEALKTEGYVNRYEVKSGYAYTMDLKKETELLLKGLAVALFLAVFAVVVCHVDVFLINICRIISHSDGSNIIHNIRTYFSTL